MSSKTCTIGLTLGAPALAEANERLMQSGDAGIMECVCGHVGSTQAALFPKAHIVVRQGQSVKYKAMLVKARLALLATPSLIPLPSPPLAATPNNPLTLLDAT